MRVSIILAHPASASFNHAIANTVMETLSANGHEVVFHDLYRERFDPVLPADEIARDAVLPRAIETHCQELSEADGLVIIHPNYWSAPPAILRGWVDRCIRPGRAYRFDATGPVGLLKVRIGLVFTTANTPHENERELFGDPLETHWLKVVFGICGVPRTRRWDFSPMIVSSSAQRAQWLREVAGAVFEHFPPVE